MTTVNDMTRRVSSLDIKNEAFIAVSETKDEITEIQKEQMYSGFLSTGNQITPLHGRYIGYAERTKQIKRSKGQVFTRVTLKDEGNFYAGLKTDVTPDVFKTTSTDFKTPDLEDYYGKDIFGLDAESKSEYAGKLKPVLVKNVRQKLKV